MAKPATAAKKAARKPVVKSGKKTQLYTEGQWNELQKSHDNYRTGYLDQVGQLEKLNIELKDANKYKEDIINAQESDMHLEMLAIKLLRQRSPKLRAFIVSRIVDAINFGLESELDRKSEDARAMGKRSDEYWAQASLVSQAQTILKSK